MEGTVHRGLGSVSLRTRRDTILSTVSTGGCVRLERELREDRQKRQEGRLTGADGA
jgi:hypothetical protein